MAYRSQNFWDFSVDLYARGRVEDACLDLQNSYRIDVNLLLLCYWHGLHHGEISDHTLELAMEQATRWNEAVIQPLRHVRKWMKDKQALFPLGDQVQFESLRQRIKLDELAGEKYEQELLEQLCLSHAPNMPKEVGVEVCERNIKKLFAAIGLAQNDLIAARLRLIAKALPEGRR